jgi:LPXTG-motif cell wall-anchored protein
MSSVLTTFLPLLGALGVAGGSLLALRRRQPEPVPAHVRRPGQRPRGCNWQ